MRMPWLTSMLVLTMASVGLAQMPGPTTLPAGHPAIGGAVGPMPAGHPAIGGADAPMPAGHPAIGGADAPMPAGHPAMGEAGTTMPTVKGSIEIQAIAGTKDGTPVGGESVTVELYHQGIVLKKWDLTLDAKGAGVINDIPVRVECQAMVTVRHGGLEQQGIGPVLDPANPTQHIDLKVYDATQTKPEWTVNMRHVIVQWAEGGEGISVTEMISAENPTDRAWMGQARDGKVYTFLLPLPAGATGVRLMGGFDESATQITNEGIYSGGPLFPGQTQFRVAYMVPAVNGTVSLPITAPADIGHMMVFVPAEGATVTAQGIEGGDKMSMGEEQQVRAFHGKDIKAGTTATLTIAGLSGKLAGEKADGVKELSAKNVAVAGAVLIGLCGVGVLFLKKPKGAKAGAKTGENRAGNARKG